MISLDFIFFLRYNIGMVFIKKTLSYIKKAFFPLMLMAIIPSVFLGFFFKPISGLTFLPQYFAAEDMSFKQIFWLLFGRESLVISGFNPAFYILIFFVAFVLLTLACSYGLSMVEKHFKTGKIIHDPIRSINNSIISVIKTFCIILSVYLLLMLLQSGLILLVNETVSAGGAPKVMDCIWTTVISLVMFVLSFAILIPPAFCTVIMQLMGYSFADAFVEAMRLVGEKWLSLTVGMLLPTLALAAIKIGISFIPLTMTAAAAVGTVVNIVIFMLYMMYVLSFSMVSVYELTGIERRDIRKSYIVRY